MKFLTGTFIAAVLVGISSANEAYRNKMHYTPPNGTLETVVGVVKSEDAFRIYGTRIAGTAPTDRTVGYMTSSNGAKFKAEFSPVTNALTGLASQVRFFVADAPMTTNTRQALVQFEVGRATACPINNETGIANCQATQQLAIKDFPNAVVGGAAFQHEIGGVNSTLLLILSQSCKLVFFSQDGSSFARTKQDLQGGTNAPEVDLGGAGCTNLHFVRNAYKSADGTETRDLISFSRTISSTIETSEYIGGKLTITGVNNGVLYGAKFEPTAGFKGYLDGGIDGSDARFFAVAKVLRKNFLGKKETVLAAFGTNMQHEQLPVTAWKNGLTLMRELNVTRSTLVPVLADSISDLKGGVFEKIWFRAKSLTEENCEKFDLTKAENKATVAKLYIDGDWIASNGVQFTYYYPHVAGDQPLVITINGNKDKDGLLKITDGLASKTAVLPKNEKGGQKEILIAVDRTTVEVFVDGIVLTYSYFRQGQTTGGCAKSLTAAVFKTSQTSHFTIYDGVLGAASRGPMALAAVLFAAVVSILAF